MSCRIVMDVLRLLTREVKIVCELCLHLAVVVFVARRKKLSTQVEV